MDRSSLAIAVIVLSLFGIIIVNALSTNRNSAMYVAHGEISVEEVDYWWVSGVGEGDLVLLVVEAETTCMWESRLYYSNLMLLNETFQGDTHIYEFVSDKADDYLLRLYAECGFNYTIQCTHPLWSHTFDLQLLAGWNMVSFPCLPIDDLSFSNILSGVGYYQVLTWDGTSYITPADAEASRGYWILVLEETIVTIKGTPVDSYELDLPTGWSMIGSIYGCAVDADLVFPGYYQLLTWDGTSYVSATTIEPGKGYWVLVLEETHIIVGETSCTSAYAPKMRTTE